MALGIRRSPRGEVSLGKMDGWSKEVFNVIDILTGDPDDIGHGRELRVIQGMAYTSKKSLRMMGTQGERLPLDVSLGVECLWPCLEERVGEGQVDTGRD